MVGDALHRAVGAVIVDAEQGGARQDAHLGQALQFGDRAGGPLGPAHAADLAPLGEQAPASGEILVHQDHPRPGAAGGERRRETGRAAADDEHVAMGVGVVVGVGIGGVGGPAEARRAPDHRLVQLLPEAGRPHEGLVVEARREDRREQRVDRERVEREGGPAVLARRLQPLVEFRHGGAGVGLAPGAGAQFDQGVRLLRAGREDAAGPVILERAADETHAVGEQRRGQRVAVVAGEAASVEAEVARPVPIDQAAGGGAERLIGRGRGNGRLRALKGERGHAASPELRARATSRAGSTASMAWVRVSRVTTSQERHPAA